MVEDRPELKEGDADLSDDDMDKIIAEGTPGAKPPKVKPLTMSTAPAVDPVIGSLSPAPQQHPMDFPALYVQAKIPVPTHGFTVHKVGTMLQAGRLGKMAPQVRGAVVLATLETNGVPVADIFEDAEARERRDKLRKVSIQAEFEEIGCHLDRFSPRMHPYARATELEREVQDYIDGLSPEMAGILSDVMPKVRAIVRSIYRLALDQRKIDLILGRDDEISLRNLIAEIQKKMVTEEGKPPVPESLMVVYKQRIALIEGRIAKRGELERRKEMIGPQLETLVETLQLVRDQVMLPMGETRVRVDVDAIVRDSIATEGSLGDVMQAVLDAEEARAELDMHEASR